MRNIEDYHISPPILEACKRLGITTLAEFLRAPESAFQEILVPAQMVELYSLVDSYNLKWGTQEERERDVCGDHLTQTGMQVRITSS